MLDYEINEYPQTTLRLRLWLSAPGSGSGSGLWLRLWYRKIRFFLASGFICPLRQVGFFIHFVAECGPMVVLGIRNLVLRLWITLYLVLNCDSLPDLYPPDPPGNVSTFSRWLFGVRRVDIPDIEDLTEVLQRECSGYNIMESEVFKSAIRIILEN